jgi:hypothetical protein
MTDEALGPTPAAAQPITRPRGTRLLWYILGGSLPTRHHSWVLHDLTCRSWWLRHFARTAVIILPLLGVYLAVVPASLSVRLLTGLTFAAAGFLFSFVNILVDTDRRAVRAGHSAGLAEQIRGTRAAEQHRLASYQRRERIAERQARRRSTR